MKGKLNACIQSNSTLPVLKGKITMHFYGMTNYLQYAMTNIKANLTKNSPGYIQIDKSTSCNETLGPYWNDDGNVTANPNPWTNETTSFYKNKDSGSYVALDYFQVNNGFYWGDNQGRAVVVLDNDRSVIGCSILSTEKCKL